MASSKTLIRDLPVQPRELVYVSDGSEDGTKDLIGNRIDGLRSLLADIRMWVGGTHIFKPAGDTVLQRSLAFYDAVGKVLAQENRP
jgi:hypothetical protein